MTGHKTKSPKKHKPVPKSPPPPPPPPPAATKSGAGQPAGAPCATCQQARPPPKPPCDYDKVEIKCKHCGKDRTISGVSFEVDPASGKTSNTQVKPASARRAPVTDRFEVIGPDEVTVTLSGGPGYGPDHPLVLLAPPDFIGPPQPRRGPSQTFKVAYEKGWVEARLANAGRLGFAASLRQFFFPPPALHRLEVLACGARPAPQRGMGRFTHAIAVYPNDTFKMSLSLPSIVKTERASSGYTEGAVKGATQGVTTTRGWGQSSESHKTETRETAESYLIRQTDAVADKRDGVTHTQTAATLRGRDYASDKIAGGEAATGPLAATAKSFTITHQGNDVTQSFKVAEFVESIAKLRKLILGVIEFFKAIAGKIGWAFTASVEVCSGSLSYEWGYKELGKDHTVYKWYKVEVAVTVISASAEIAFGAELLGAKAQVYGSLAGELKLSGSREAEPDGAGPAASIVAAPKFTGEIGVRGALGDWIVVVGKITGGFEGSSTIALAPFSWKASVELSAGKGTFVVKSKLWFDTEAEAEIWAKMPIWEGTLIG